VVSTEVDVHEPRHAFVFRRVLVELHALYQRRRTVADADDRDADLGLMIWKGFS
jgi:hypothetical protein